MDHITMPRNPRHPPIKIPLFCTEDFAAESFTDYFANASIQTNSIVTLARNPDSREQVHFLLQHWAFFGLMSEIFEKDIHVEDFTQLDDDGGKWLSTKILPRFVAEWIQRQSMFTSQEREIKKFRMKSCIDKVCRTLMDIYMETKSALDLELVATIVVLVEHLAAAESLAFDDLNQNWEEYEPQPAKYPGMLRSAPQGKELIAERMLRDGWCPNEVHMLGMNNTVASLYFMSNLDRPGPYKDHHVLRCTANQCNAYQIRQNEYERKHATSVCSCHDLFALQQDLLRILSEDEDAIPLIAPFSTSETGTRTAHVCLVSSRVAKEYVAISHVWSDGLGNENHNAIPMCQFNRLSKLVAELYGGSPKPFWLDTLCFPLEPPEAYNLAMIRMRSTYDDAHKVLVLDGYLLGQESEGMSVNEIVTRIMCSPWNRRLWTLQEGALASSIAFQFSDTYVVLPANTRKSYNKADPGYEVFSKQWTMFHQLRNFDWYYDGKPDGPISTPKAGVSLFNMGDAKDALAFRSTSVQKDEALCLSALLALDIEVILSAPEEEWMKQVWLMVPWYSPAIIFWNDPKLPYDGLRWAPSSLLRGSLVPVDYWSPNYPNNSKAELTDKGLIVSFPGVLLSGAHKPLNCVFHFQDESGACFEVLCQEDRDGVLPNVGPILDPWLETAAPMTNLAVISPKMLDSTYEPSAILVSVQEINDERIYVRWLYSVAVVQVESSEADEVKKHIDVDRDYEAVSRATDVAALESGLGRSTDMEETEQVSHPEATEAGDPLDFNVLYEQEYEQLKDIDHDLRPLLCDCKAQWVVRGRHTKPNQIWCVD